MRVLKKLPIVVVLIAVNAAALDPEPGAVFVRVFDVGAGLCCVAVLPDDHFIIYDAGYFRGDGEQAAMTGIEELIPENAKIDLLVLSHSDADSADPAWIASDAPIGPPPIAGDLNCDGEVDGADIEPFFLAVAFLSRYVQEYPHCNYLQADINGDGFADGADIDPFFDCLGFGGCP